MQTQHLQCMGIFYLIPTLTVYFEIYIWGMQDVVHAHSAFHRKFVPYVKFVHK